MISSETQSSGPEPSLADLYQKSLWLSRSALQNLEEVGQGNRLFMLYHKLPITIADICRSVWKSIQGSLQNVQWSWILCRYQDHQKV